MATTSPLAAGYVLVGVGTSPAAMAAARWAAAEAVRRGAVLYAIHVLPATHSQDDLTEARRRVPTRVGDWLADTTTLPVVAVRVTSGDLAQELEPTPERPPSRSSEVRRWRPTTDYHISWPAGALAPSSWSTPRGMPIRSPRTGWATRPTPYLWSGT